MQKNKLPRWILHHTAHSTNLIGLGDVSEHDINHANEHAALVGVASFLNNGNHVGALLGLEWG
jgi:hypothetical protein